MPVPDDLQTANGSGLLGWEAVDLPLLLLLPLLLVLSGFFSGSETALFGLTATDRMQLRRANSNKGTSTQQGTNHRISASAITIPSQKVL